MSRRESGRHFTPSTTQNYGNTQTSLTYNEEMSENVYNPATYIPSVGTDDHYYAADKGGYPTSYRGSQSYSRSSYDNYYGNDSYENTRHSSQTPPTSNSMFDSYSDPIYNDFNNIRPPSDGIPYEDNRGGNHYTELREPYPTDTYNRGSYGEYTLENGTATKPPINQVSEPLSSKQRQQRKCCCCSCSRRICVFVTFFIIIALAIIIFFLWPRIPSVSILPDAKPSGTPVIKQSPATIEMQFTMNAQIQNPENWVGIRFNKISADVYDVTTLSSYNFPIANTTITDYTLPPRTTTTLPFTLSINYRGNSSSDAVVEDFLYACFPSTGAKATTLNVRADITLDLWGIGWIYKPKLSIGESNFRCPFSQSI